VLLGKEIYDVFTNVGISSARKEPEGHLQARRFVRRLSGRTNRGGVDAGNIRCGVEFYSISNLRGCGGHAVVCELCLSDFGPLSMAQWRICNVQFLFCKFCSILYPR